jgi:hypothetical protein
MIDWLYVTCYSAKQDNWNASVRLPGFYIVLPFSFFSDHDCILISSFAFVFLRRECAPALL